MVKKHMTYYIKVIKNEEDHKEALALVDELMLRDPQPDSEDGEKLSLLATLIEDYESRIIPESIPDPVEAILFRMEQQALKPIDLVPFIGSRSKVSEILSRKRPLTLAMIRALEAGLGIPAKVLVREADDLTDPEKISWDRFPLKEMSKRGYFKEKPTKTNEIKVLLQKFLEPLYGPNPVLGLLRKTNYRFTRPVDKYALAVWTAFVIKKAKDLGRPNKYKKGTVNLEFMKKVAQLSSQENGPILARNYLKDHGVILVVESHFEQTYLDGATLIVGEDNPIIALTIRFDRLDNFWFTLMHELAHLALHSEHGAYFFYDDLESKDLKDDNEIQADDLAGEALVPKKIWDNSPAKLIPSPIAAVGVSV